MESDTMNETDIKDWLSKLIGPGFVLAHAIAAGHPCVIISAPDGNAGVFEITVKRSSIATVTTLAKASSG